MKTVTVIVRSIFGLVFLVFGLNGLFHLFDMPPMPAAAQQFFGGLAATGYLLPVLFTVQAVCGALLLAGVLVPLALTLLAPIMVNIILFHIFLAPAEGLAAYVSLVLQLFLMWQYRDYYRSLFVVWAVPSGGSRHTAAGHSAATVGSR
jgi:uncharacterized membrane protein YphA (DoxX/SURF4 family)